MNATEPLDILDEPHPERLGRREAGICGTVTHVSKVAFPVIAGGGPQRHAVAVPAIMDMLARREGLGSR